MWLTNHAKRAVSKYINNKGLMLVPTRIHADFTDEERYQVAAVKPYTMTSPERVVALSRMISYIVRADIPGAIVECGVWRGGSAMVMARSLLRNGDRSRDIYLYDTYEGMPKPTSADVRDTGEVAFTKYRRTLDANGRSDWAVATIDEVSQNVASTGYPKDRTYAVKGEVETTIPGTAPARIALLRLDTDFYSSTLHELTHLYWRMAPGGIVLLDDYGEWLGSKRAVDEFLTERGIEVYLNRIDHSARSFVVPFDRASA